LKRFIPYITTVALCALLIQSIGQYFVYDLSSFANSPLENSSERDTDEKSENEEKLSGKDGDEFFGSLVSSGFNHSGNSKFAGYNMAHYELIFLDKDTPPPQSVG